MQFMFVIAQLDETKFGSSMYAKTCVWVECNSGDRKINLLTLSFTYLYNTEYSKLLYHFLSETKTTNFEFPRPTIRYSIRTLVKDAQM